MIPDQSHESEAPPARVRGVRLSMSRTLTLGLTLLMLASLGSTLWIAFGAEGYRFNFNRCCTAVLGIVFKFQILTLHLTVTRNACWPALTTIFCRTSWYPSRAPTTV